ncbi:MAG: bifunctional glutamate N-acetyltransferase/amino-acid acetyltransferase ArgJ [Pseudomonadota bacterium]
MTTSPLAPACFPNVPDVPGVQLSTARSGIKYQDRDDVLLAVLVPGTTVAGVFTKSATCSAAVLDCRAKLSSPSDQGAAILVNAGNANAFTGNAGQAAVDAVCQATSTATHIPTNRIFTASTGVIGEVLPHNRITAHLNAMSNQMDAGFQAAADAIRTTDTFAKGATAKIVVDGTPITISGIAKGSGMIAPDMATMLAYVFTDAQIDQASLQALTVDACNRSFNAITVDSDTSTSDTLMVCATGISGQPVAGSDTFADALVAVLTDLAHQIVRDGEGATKFVEVQVKGAQSDADARKVALSIANSPLVKTAIAGEDPNWGRIVMAVGKSGAAADRDRLAIAFGDIQVASNGWIDPTYSEDQGAAYMKNQDLVIQTDLGLGSGTSTVWTCDLTHGYITINADYRS